MDIEQFYINRISQLLNIIATLNNEINKLKETLADKELKVRELMEDKITFRKEHDGAPCADMSIKAGGSE